MDNQNSNSSANYFDSIFFNPSDVELTQPENTVQVSFTYPIEPYQCVDGINSRSGVPINAYNGNVPNWCDSNGSLIQGVYIDMPEKEYHLITAVSSTGIKTFANNPHKAEKMANGDLDFEISPQLKLAFDAGHYLHGLLLEPHKADHGVSILSEPDELRARGLTVLESNDDLKQFIDDKYLQSGKTIQERIDIIQSNYKGVIYYPHYRIEQENKNSRLLTRETATKIENTVKDIQQSKTHGRLFDGGYSELTIIAYDESRGEWVKARLDKVTADNKLIDVKTIYDLSVGQITRDIDQKLYSIQGAFYHYVARLAGFNLEQDVFGLLFVEWDTYQRSLLVEIGDIGWQKSIKYMHEIFDDYVGWMRSKVVKSSITQTETIMIEPRLFDLSRRVRTEY